MAISVQDQNKIQGYFNDIKQTLNKDGFRERQAADIAGIKETVWRNRDAFGPAAYDSVMNSLTRLNSDILDNNGATAFNKDVSQLLTDLHAAYDKPGKPGKPEADPDKPGKPGKPKPQGEHTRNGTIGAYGQFADDLKANKSPETLKKDIDGIRSTLKDNKDFSTGQKNAMLFHLDGISEGLGAKDAKGREALQGHINGFVNALTNTDHYGKKPDPAPKKDGADESGGDIEEPGQGKFPRCTRQDTLEQWDEFSEDFKAGKNSGWLTKDLNGVSFTLKNNPDFTAEQKKAMNKHLDAIKEGLGAKDEKGREALQAHINGFLKELTGTNHDGK
jgi:hypothetical protein